MPRDFPRHLRYAGCLALFGLVSFAVGVMAAQTDQLTRKGFRSSICNINSMVISFKVDEAFGEPLVTSQMGWVAGPNTSEDCLSKLTHIWVSVRTSSGRLAYLKLSPSVQRSGLGRGARVTESPSWNRLFCTAASDDATCAGAAEAQALFADSLRFEAFEVVTEGVAVSTLANNSRSERRDAEATNISVDALLADAIDSALNPDAAPDSQADDVPLLPEPVPLTAEEIGAQQAERKRLLAEKATSNVVNLLAGTLARHKTPATGCESNRSVANWVQVLDQCTLNFRTEESHNYLCADDGAPRPLRATRRAEINLGKNLRRISDIRVSDAGWASVILYLDSELRTTEEGDYTSSRWQFTVDSKRIDDLQTLAESIATLQDYCRSNTSS